MSEDKFTTRIETTYDDRELKRATEDEKRLAQATKQTGESADKASRELDRQSDATRKSGDEATDASRKSGKLSSSIDGLAQSAASYVAGVFGVGGVIEALRAQREEMELNAAAANRLKQSQLDLQFLGEGYNAAEIAAVRRAAEIKGGDPTEAYVAYGEFKSKTATLTEAERLDLFAQQTESSLTTNEGIGALTPLFTKSFPFFGKNSERMQNALREAQNLSPVANPNKLSKDLPGILDLGNRVGLSAEQSTGLLVAALSIDEESGANQLRNVLLTLGGTQTPEQDKLLKSLGADEDQGILKQLDALKSANLQASEIASISGKESFQVLSGLLGDSQYRQFIASIEAKASSATDSTRTAIKGIYGQDEQQALRLKTDQAEARIELMRADDIDAQRAALGRKIVEEQLTKEDRYAITKILKLAAYDAAVGSGFSPASAADIAKGVGFRNILGGAELYTGEDLGQKVYEGLIGPIDSAVEDIPRLGAGGNITINNIAEQNINAPSPGEAIVGRASE